MDNEKNMELDNIVTLEDENGAEVPFEFLDLVEYQGEEYVVLLPVEEESEEVLILHVGHEDEETDSYTGVEDEETLNAVFALFKEKFRDVFNFVDES